jgi:cystathionine beta-synthase
MLLLPYSKRYIKKGRRLKNSRAGIIRIPTEATWDAPEPHIGVARKLRDETLYADIFYQYGNHYNLMTHYDTAAEELFE